MDLDSMLEHLGHFGLFQVTYFTMLLFPVIIWGFRATEYIFTTLDIPHRCRVPECEGTSGPTQFIPVWLREAVPFSAPLTAAPDPCLRYLVRNISNQGNLTSCPADLFNTSHTETCNSWVFDEPTRTIAQDFDIMCPGDTWKLTMLSSLSVLTSVIGLPLVGLLSDRFGRKTVLVSGASILSVTGLLRSFSPYYGVLAALELFDGLVTGTIFGTAFLLGLETLAPSRRLLGSMLINVYFTVGEVVLALVMWLTQDWRLLLRVFYTPMLAVVTLYWLMPESLRWLYTKGRYDDVERVFRKIACFNKTEDKLPAVIRNLRNSGDEDAAFTSKDQVRSLRLTAVFRSRIIMCRLGVYALCWIASIFSYYGLSQNAAYFKGDRYVSFVFVSLIEVPAYLSSMWLPDWSTLGRRGCLAGSFILGAVACFITILLPADKIALSLIFSLASKFCSTLGICVIYLYTAEVFPTELRHSLLSTCSMVGRFGFILSQQAPLVSAYVNPMLIFGAVSLGGGLLTLSCPETLNTKLPDTIQEAEDIGREPKRGKHAGKPISAIQ